MPDKWSQYAQPATATDKWAQYVQPAVTPAVPDDGRNIIQKSFDENTKTSPSEPLLQTGLKSVVGAIGAPFVHPLQTAKGVLDLVPDSPDVPIAPTHENPLVGRGIAAYHDAKDGGLGYSATKLAGETFGATALDGLVRGAPGATRGLGDTASAIRQSAIGNPDVAALRGLRVGQGSKQALGTLSSVQGARPFLQGASDLADLQAKIPVAKSEIWSPYEDALGRVGDTKTPLGTAKELEARRLELSGQLRLVKSRNPGDIALAAQQGLDKSALLAEEKRITSTLDPILRDAGVDAGSVRKSYAQVGRIGSRIEGRSTLNEAAKPYGFNKLPELLTGVDLTKPSTYIKPVGNLFDIGKDLTAGRYTSAKPTDVAIREAFRNGGAKPNFLTEPKYSEPAGYLPSSTIGEPGGPDYSQGALPSRNPIITQPPAQLRGLPASAGAGEVQPMVAVRNSPYPELNETTARLRIRPTEFSAPEIIPPRLFQAGDQVVRNPLLLEANEPRGLLGVQNKKKK